MVRLITEELVKSSQRQAVASNKITNSSVKMVKA